MSKEPNASPRAASGGPATSRLAPPGSFGRTLSEERERGGLTRAEMARRITATSIDGFRCTPQHVTYWEGGQRQVTEEVAQRYARALGLTASIHFSIHP